MFWYYYVPEMKYSSYLSNRRSRYHPKKWPLTSKEGRMLFSRYTTTNTPPFIFTRIRYCESFFMTQMINCFFEDCLKSSKTWRKNYKNLLSRNKRQQLWKARVKWYMWRIWTIIKSKENWHDAFAKNRNEGYLSEGYWKYHFLWYFFVVGIFRFSSFPLPSPRMSLWLSQTLNYSGLLGV